MPTVELVNRQRKIRINQKFWVDFSETVVQTVAETGNKSMTIAFVSDLKMRELNRTFRGKNLTTDVLSFPYQAETFETSKESFAIADKYLGDIAISLKQAERQSVENNLDFETEIKQLILHGILHLCGFDHETDDGEMKNLELKYRQKLKI